ncbi:hypothetical protein WJX72_003418 [[Myrmecia] bisecta]|uniref:phosphoribosylaminoimidazole carboxylase n=1 Tax=[Myrmecia] bisecta TaxID=41462 RepID=A0AAW1QF64_9CHLO
MPSVSLLYARICVAWQKQPKEICVREADASSTWSFEELQLEVFKVHKLLQAKLAAGAGLRAHAAPNAANSRAARPALIGICLERSALYVTAVLAALRAGAAFLPLDPLWPDDRLQLVLSDAEPDVVIWASSQHGGAGRPPVLAANLGILLQLPAPGLDPANPSLPFDTGALQRHASDALPGSSVANMSLRLPVHASQSCQPAAVEACDAGALTLSRASAWSDVAYVMYTSGSTGKPKGVCGTLQGILNRCKWWQEVYGLQADDIGCFKTSPCFVDAIWEMFAPLLAGIMLVVVPQDTVRNPAALLATLAAHRVTHFVAVPSLLRALEPHLHPRPGLQLKVVVSSGGPLTCQLLQRLQVALPGTRILNLYGSTEQHTVELLDRLAGSGTIRMFRTGDQGRITANGLELRGRVDLQVKLAGVRVDLSEVEAILLDHPMVQAAITRVWPGPHGAGQRLAAYVELHASSATSALLHPSPDVEDQLRLWCHSKLPAGAVPFHVSVLHELPSTVMRGAAGVALTLDGQHVAVACGDQQLYFLEACSGQLTGSCDVGGAMQAAPTVDPWRGLVWVGSHSRELVACAAPGRVVWRLPCTGALSAAPTFDPQRHRVYAADLSGALTAYVAEAACRAEPQVCWRHTCLGPIFAAPAVLPHTGTVIVNAVDGTIAALSHQGAPLWSLSLGAALFAPLCMLPPHPSSGTWAAVGTQTGSIHILDCVAGALLLSQQLADSPLNTSVLSMTCVAEVAMPGEMFSPPVVLGPLCLFGSRDDHGASHVTQGELSSSNGAASSQLMDPRLLELLQRVAAGELSPETATIQLHDRSSGYQQVMDFAQVDAWRAQRTGFPEVVWGPGKSPEQIAAIMGRMAENESVVMATRITPEVSHQVQRYLPEVEYNAPAGILLLKSSTGKRKQPRLPGIVAVLSAGTADEGVAEECKAVADVLGCYCFRLADVSVDGLHRILANLSAVRAADVVIVISGTDGALPAVVAGLVEAPVIAVPTSVGYGAALSGITPLLSALTASSPGVCVVNIDSGFGAAMIAARILQTVGKLRRAAAPPAAGGNGSSQ